MNRARTNAEMNNDETFLGLLSSQRKLLAQISAEGRHSPSEGQQGEIPGNFSDFPVHNSLGQQHYYPSAVAPNHSIAIRDQSMNESIVLSRRFSLSLGNSMVNFPHCTGSDGSKTLGPSFASDPASCDASPAGDMFSNCNRKRVKDEFDFDDFPSTKRRRFSGFGLAFLDELPLSHYQEKYDRRLSMSSLAPSRMPMSNFSDGGLADNEDLMHTFDDTRTTSFTFPTPQPFEYFPMPTMPAVKPAPRFVAPPVTYEVLVSLTDAMEKTQKSQQDIHDWDRKMGLKRSHSKTMRLSMRSRKKLRTMLKKKITALSSKKKR